MGYQFEWDAGKAEANERKHGIPFQEASTVFGDPLAINVLDPYHSEHEARCVLVGLSDRRRLLVVCYADRPPRTRIISARRATPRERRQYEEGE